MLRCSPETLFAKFLAESKCSCCVATSCWYSQNTIDYAVSILRPKKCVIWYWRLWDFNSVPFALKLGAVVLCYFTHLRTVNNKLVLMWIKAWSIYLTIQVCYKSVKKIVKFWSLQNHDLMKVFVRARVNENLKMKVFIIYLPREKYVYLCGSTYLCSLCKWRRKHYSCKYLLIHYIFTRA